MLCVSWWGLLVSVWRAWTRFRLWRCRLVLGPLLVVAVVAGVLSTVPEMAAAAPTVAPSRMTESASVVQQAAEAASARALAQEARASGSHSGVTSAVLSGADAAVQAKADAAAPARSTSPQSSPSAVQARDAALEASAAAARTANAAAEVPSLTTATQQTVANPDGTFTTSVSARPVRYRDSAGNWRSLSLALPGSGARRAASAAGPWAARVADQGGAIDGLVQSGPAGSQFSWSPSGMANVAIAAAGSSSSATYPQALSGGRDVVEQVTADGAEESVVVPTRAALGSATGAYRDVFTVPAGVTGRQAKALGDGSSPGVEFVNSTGAVVASFGGGSAADSSGSLGLPGGVGPADREPARSPVITRLIGQSGSQVTVEVGAPAAWLADPARVFPVTIDPHMTAGTSWNGDASSSGSFDAYVDQANPTQAEGTYDPTNLKVGYRPVNAGSYNSATYVGFNLGDFNDSENHVLSASLSLNNIYDYSCTALDVAVTSAGSGWNPSGLTWNQQPGLVGPTVSKSYAHGYPSGACSAAARESYDVTAIAQDWANGPHGYNSGFENYGLKVYTTSTSQLAYKRFGAAENGSGQSSSLSVSWENCTFYGQYKVCGALRDDYTRVLSYYNAGLPTSNASPTANGDGQVQYFANGASMFYSAATGAHMVVGATRDEWGSQGYERGALGYPTSDWYPTDGHDGYYTNFQHGVIFENATYGAHTVSGPVLNEWAAQGCGTPTSRPTSTTAFWSIRPGTPTRCPAPATPARTFWAATWTTTHVPRSPSPPPPGRP